MALKRTSPAVATEPAVAAPSSRYPFSFTLVERLKRAPFGGVIGAVAAGGTLWLAPTLKPETWTDQAFVAFGLGAGLALDRGVALATGWFFSPAMRHLTAHWDAILALGKLDRYRKSGILDSKDAKRLATRIATADVNGGARIRTTRQRSPPRAPPNNPIP